MVSFLRDVSERWAWRFVVRGARTWGKFEKPPPWVPVSPSALSLGGTSVFFSNQNNTLVGHRVSREAHVPSPHHSCRTENVRLVAVSTRHGHSAGQLVSQTSQELRILMRSPFVPVLCTKPRSFLLCPLLLALLSCLQHCGHQMCGGLPQPSSSLPGPPM